jgi:pterin-4a-carbinolamine dehydratase
MATELEEIANHTVTTRSNLTPHEVTGELEALGTRWTIDGPDLRLDLKGPMAKTGAVVAHAGALADELDHHPSISLEYAGLVLKIHTHDKNAITVLDLVYAARLEQWLRTNGWA